MRIRPDFDARPAALGAGVIALLAKGVLEHADVVRSGLVGSLAGCAVGVVAGVAWIVIRGRGRPSE